MFESDVKVLYLMFGPVTLSNSSGKQGHQGRGDCLIMMNCHLKIKAERILPHLAGIHAFV